MKETRFMNTLKFLIGAVFLTISASQILGQPESASKEDDKTLITIHAEDAFLPSLSLIHI